MTRTSAMPPYTHCLAALMLLAACRSSTPSAPVRVVDLHPRIAPR